MGLLLHCGGERVERTDLAKIELPERTKTWTPVGHDQLLDIVEDAFGEIGFKFGAEAHGLSHNGDRYFGVVELKHKSQNEDYALVCGVRNSTDKTFPAGLAFGSHVFVCDNLAFGAERVVNRKHTSRILIELPGLIRQAVAQTKALSVLQDQRFDIYRETAIPSDQVAHDLIVKLLLAGAINTSRVEKVVNEYHEPSFDHGARTAWRLFNAATQVLKEAPIHDLPPRTIAAQNVLDEFVEFEPDFAMLEAA